MELRHVEYVLSVIDQGSFTAGAAASGVTQPTLSEGIRRLETELGVRLFDRIGRHVVVTDAGRAFEGPARTMVRARAVVLDAVGAVRELDSGTLDLVALADARGRSARGVGRSIPRAASRGRRARGRAGRRERARGPGCRRSAARSVWPSCRRAATTSSRSRSLRQEIVAVCPPGTQLPAPGRLPVGRLAGMPLVATPPGTSTRDLLDHARWPPQRSRPRLPSRSRNARRSLRSCSAGRVHRSYRGRWRSRSARRAPSSRGWFPR